MRQVMELPGTPSRPVSSAGSSARQLFCMSRTSNPWRSRWRPARSLMAGTSRPASARSGGLQPLKARLAVGVVAAGHTPSQRHMKVDIQIERIVKVLDERIAPVMEVG